MKFKPPDFFLLFIVEKVYIQIQNLTGLARWQMARALFSTFIVSIIVELMVDLFWVGVAAAPMYAYLSLRSAMWASMKRAQELADRNQAPVLNEHRGSMASFFVRMSVIMLFSFRLIHLRNNAPTIVPMEIGVVALIIYVYLGSINTWPRMKPHLFATIRPEPEHA